MRIQVVLPQGYNGPKGDKAAAGEVVDFRDELALKLIAAGFAVAAPPEAPKPIETVAKAAPQTTAKRVGKAPPRKTVK